MKHYINQTEAELWIPLFPLLPDYTLLDETEFTVRLHQKMLESFKAENMVWLGFSGGADVLFQAGRYIVQKCSEVPMPGMMIPVSVSGLLMSEKAKAWMREIEPGDPILTADMFDTMLKYYNPNGDLPQYILGKADEDDYTGFPKIIMYFGGDEVFAGIAPDYSEPWEMVIGYLPMKLQGIPMGIPKGVVRAAAESVGFSVENKTKLLANGTHDINILRK